MRLLVLSLSMLVISETCAETTTISVCEALTRGSALNGKIVSLRGLQEATDEGAWLKDPSCSQTITIDGRPEHALIWLEMSGPRRTAAGFGSVDVQSSVKRINATLAKQGYAPSKDRLWLTYVGLFWFGPAIARETEGKIQEGFGHMNAAPAELIVKDVMDVVVEKSAKATPGGKEKEQ